MQEYSFKKKYEGKKIGFVPTMGYLHHGHLSLIEVVRKHSDICVVSIFVNPAQFAPGEDFNDYPRNFERDSELLRSKDVDIIFYPSHDEIYPDGFQSFIEVTELSKQLEGEFRPTHFRGVATVVAMLFNIVQPDVACFGRKDAQQAEVIKKMVNELKFPIDIIVAPIMREPDGLAMSSRNIYLTQTERNDAKIIFQSIQLAKEIITKGERKSINIIKLVLENITSVETANPDYVRIVQTDTFQETELLEYGKSYYILIACRFGSTRLIDNELINI